MSIMPKKPRGRPRKAETMDTLAVRLPDDLVKRVDSYCERLRTDLPGLNVARADAIRQLLIVGLQTEEKRLNR
jgi:hypothetical protein